MTKDFINDSKFIYDGMEFTIHRSTNDAVISIGGEKPRILVYFMPLYITVDQAAIAVRAYLQGSSDGRLQSRQALSMIETEKHNYYVGKK